MTGSTAAGDGFRHEAFFYADPDQFIAGALPFVEAGVAAGEAVLIAVPEPNRRLLREALGGAVSGVEFVEMEELGRNPGRIISAWHDFVRSQQRTGFRGIGEPIWAGRSAEEVDECQRHEQLLNLAFDGGPAWTLMCPYNAAALGDEVLCAAEHSHPHCSGPHQGRGRREAEPAELLAGTLPEPDRPTLALSFGETDLPEVRRLVGERATAAGLRRRRAEDLVLAVCEIATNSVRHGGGEGTLRVWDEGGLVCDVRDSGLIRDPLVGRDRPPQSQVGGRGVWIAHHLCDLVQVRSGEHGTQVRLRMSV